MLDFRRKLSGCDKFLWCATSCQAICDKIAVASRQRVARLHHGRLVVALLWNNLGPQHMRRHSYCDSSAAVALARA